MTLLETTLATAIFAVIMGVVFYVLQTQNTVADQEMSEADIQTNLRKTMDILVNQLTEARVKALDSGGMWIRYSVPYRTTYGLPNVDSTGASQYGAYDDSGKWWPNGWYLLMFLRAGQVVYEKAGTTAADYSTVYCNEDIDGDGTVSSSTSFTVGTLQAPDLVSEATAHMDYNLDGDQPDTFMRGYFVRYAYSSAAALESGPDIFTGQSVVKLPTTSAQLNWPLGVFYSRQTNANATGAGYPQRQQAEASDLVGTGYSDLNGNGRMEELDMAPAFQDYQNNNVLTLPGDMPYGTTSFYMRLKIQLMYLEIRPDVSKLRTLTSKINLLNIPSATDGAQ